MKNDKKTMKLAPRNGKSSKAVFVFLLLIYFISSFMLIMASRSNDNVVIFGQSIRFTAFTGVFSATANICIIFIVVFFGKIGFITALSFLIIQFPTQIINFVVFHIAASIPGAFSNLSTILAVVIIYLRSKKVDEYRETEIEILKNQQMVSRRLFEQTATALVNAVDAKDPYSHGHSLRVAEYSAMIAKAYGMSEEECLKVYYAALLHDIGKIGIPISIINKNGKLTDEEYDIIKQHTVKGNQILSSINEYPYLSIGAHYHHERYDGKGYPDKLKGEDIPEIARIISVADAYDAMTSNRSYRTALPQDLVREEIVKGAGTQFDPKFAEIMRKLIDIDVEYQMKEKNSVTELAGKNELICGKHREKISDGIVITNNITKIHMKAKLTENGSEKGRGPSLLLFDSLDGRYHNEEKTIRDLVYSEFCEVWLDGGYDSADVRKVQVKTFMSDTRKEPADRDVREYNIEAVKYKDHVLISIDDGHKLIEVTVALSDSSRYTYIGLTGEYCHISDVSIEKTGRVITSNYISRIEDKISYIEGPVGDIPNLQVDGHLTEYTEGIPITNRLNINFHTMSLPTARLVWHCPYLVIYSSNDGRVKGPGYKEYVLVRLDGENWDEEEMSENTLIVDKKADFEGWDAWKAFNKKGYDCNIKFVRKGNIITTETENFQIYIKNTTKILSQDPKIYIALTGDQCALTNIKIGK